MSEIKRGNESTRQAIREKLHAHNIRFITEYEEYVYSIENEAGELIAGIAACRDFDTMEVEFLVVDEKHRGQGYGAQLLTHIENIARQDKAVRVFLNTFSFQAPDFYRKQGYTEIARVPLGQYYRAYYVKEL